ncbi:MAG: HyaD/HybD family hydrogenase maturation endopeptidase [Gammaproteobacteria bacterium]|nr:HyaD/HybD family hydrogenase maturation endopeptidase [Gammaproteobacteria bacterium]NNJ93933.1 HyaD/HybD family hydrogenase maturation endopeptidase [Halobacteria archaeon]
MSSGEIDTLVLGIGNILWADEGFGVRCIEELNAGWEFPTPVRLMDGGTQGMFLLPWISNVSRLLIFDAIDFGLAPGELRVIRDDDVPQYMGAKKVSMHQTGFQEVLASARMLTGRPEQLALIGVQPERLDDFGGSLREGTRERIPAALEEACAVLQEWGIELRKRAVPLDIVELTGPGELDMTSYELGRPA